jgi:hypothetical protein
MASKTIREQFEVLKALAKDVDVKLIVPKSKGYIDYQIGVDLAKHDSSDRTVTLHIVKDRIAP